MADSKYHVLINSRSGTALKFGQQKIEELIHGGGHFGLESFDFLEPEPFNQRMNELLDSPMPILIGGGDGTIAKSAALHLKKGKAFGILPFGTMNLLAQDLKIPLEFEQSLLAHKNTKTIAIDVGLVNEEPFLCCVAWGTMPEAAKLREEHRGIPDVILLPRLTAYISKQIDLTQKRRVKLTLDGRASRINTGMLIVSNNMYDPVVDAEPFRKTSLQEGVFGVYVVTPHNLIDKLRLSFNLKRGGWKRDPSIQEYRARDVTIETMRNKELISIDGEPMDMRGPYKFKLLKKALKVIVPADSEKEA